MIFFSPAKINIGLQILEKRPDGFHNLQSVMVPTGLCDILEIHMNTNKGPEIQFTQSGLRFPSYLEDNLCLKAWHLFSREVPLPPVQMHLHKQIPVGAGLGGGSSNASVTLLGLNKLSGNPLKKEELTKLAEILGSDCPFFLNQVPMLMEGRGELLSPVRLRLEGYYLVLLFPKIHVSTADAYQGVSPRIPERYLRALLQEPLSEWRGLITNDFESSVFTKYPRIQNIKQQLYAQGAVYASMSGSGSSLYGIFDKRPSFPDELRRYVIWEGPI